MSKRRRAGNLNRKIPSRENIASIFIDENSRRIFFVTKDILINQIYRDGPLISSSFDGVAKEVVKECSSILSMAQSMLIRHLPKIDDRGSEATCARLLNSAAHSYVAAIEVARKGYPREFGVLMRLIVETIATVLAIAIQGRPTLEKFQEGKLESTKCIGVAKKVLPFLGKLNGELSNKFVHISPLQDSLSGPLAYTKGDSRLDFVMTTMKLMAILLDIVAELVFASDIKSHRYWKKSGEGWTFSPTKDVLDWIEQLVPSANVNPDTQESQ